MNRHILEEIVTLFTGDTKAYDKAMNHIRVVTQRTVNQVQVAVTQINSSIATAGVGVAKTAHNFGRGVVRGAGLTSGKMMTTAGKMGWGLGAFGSSGFAMANVLGNVSKKFAAGLNRMEYHARVFGHTFRNYVTLPILAIGGASVFAFAKFDDEIHKAIALFGGVNDQTRKMMESEIFRISKGSRIGPQELAEQLSVLASAGFNATQSMKMLGVAERFAVASGMKDAAESTRLLIGVQSALGMRVENVAENMENAKRVGNLLAKSNALATGEIEDFARALTNKAAAGLRMVGKDAEEGLAILAAYAQQNVKGAEAGTRFVNVLRDIQRQSLKHQGVWDKIFGKNSVFDAQGKLRPLGDVLETITNGLDKMTDKEKAAAVHMMGLQDRSSAGIQMLMGMGKEIRKFDGALRNASDTMEEMYQERMKSFLSVLKNIWNWIHITGIELGRLLSPEIKGMGKALQAILGWWGKLSDTTKSTIVRVAVALAGLGIVAGIFAGVAGALAALVAAVAFVGEGVAGIVATVAGVAALIYIIPGVTDAVIILGKAIAKTFNQWVYSIKTIYGAWRTFIDIVFMDVKQLPIFFENLGYNFGIVMGGMQRIFAAFTGWMAAKLRHVFTWQFLAAIGEGIIAAIGLFSSFMKFISDGMLAALKGVFGGGKGFKEGFEDQLKLALKDFGKAFEEEDLGKTVEDILKDMNSKFRALDKGIDLGKKMEDHIVAPAQDAANAAKGAQTEYQKLYDILNSNPIEGVLSDSVEAFDLVRQHLELMGLGNPKVMSGLNAMTGAPDFMAPEMSHPGPSVGDGEIVSVLKDILGEMKMFNVGRPSKVQEPIQFAPLRLQ